MQHQAGASGVGLQTSSRTGGPISSRAWARSPSGDCRKQPAARNSSRCCGIYLAHVTQQPHGRERTGIESRSAMALSPGSQVGPYEITAHLDAGGMGEVYLATDAGSNATSRSRSCPRPSRPIRNDWRDSSARRKCSPRSTIRTLRTCTDSRRWHLRQAQGKRARPRWSWSSSKDRRSPIGCRKDRCPSARRSRSRSSSPTRSPTGVPQVELRVILNWFEDLKRRVPTQ